MFKRMTDTCAALGLAAAGCILLATAAEAQAVRFIATSGSNANACTREAPCRTLQRGINRTPEGGVLHILDSGAYGNATIGRSITISAEGVNATVGAITIDGATARVILRNLLLNGSKLPSGTDGILITAADRVHILGCEIENFRGGGISIQTFAAAVFVADTISRSNSDGLETSSSARLTVDNSRFERNSTGMRLSGGARVTITRTVVAQSGGNGVVISGGTRATVKSSVVAESGADGYSVFDGEIIIESSLATENSHGVISNPNGTARVSNSTITGNTIGLRSNGGLVFSRQNNTVAGNETADTTGPILAFGPI